MNEGETTVRFNRRANYGGQPLAGRPQLVVPTSLPILLARQQHGMSDESGISSSTTRAHQHERTVLVRSGIPKVSIKSFP